MSLTNVTKYKFREMGGILIFFVILGIVGILVNLRSEDFPLLRSIIAIVIFGALTALHEIVISPKLSKFNFTINLGASVLFYYFTFSLVIVLMGYSTLVYKNGLTWEQAFKTDYYTIFPEGIGQPMLLLGLSVSLLVVIRFANLMLGQGVLFKYLSGRYHKPRNEERIFMFLDLKSSTEIAERLGHEKYSLFLKDFFNELDEAILGTGGYLFQYVGDEIVMVWGSKNGFKNNNCIKFYFMVKKIINNLHSQFLDRYGVFPEYKAGLHFGIVSITEIGSIRKSIAYHGDTINTTARICAKCKELDEELLISENLYKRIEKKDDYLFENIGQHSLKGKKNKLNLYRVSNLKN